MHSRTKVHEARGVPGTFFFDCLRSLRGRLILAGLLIESVIVLVAVSLVFQNDRILAIVLFFAAMAGAVISIHTDRRLRANVAKLIEATSLIFGGAGEGKAYVDTGDQLEILGNRFNLMADAIRQREADNLQMQAQLNEQALKLESDVAARTRELAEEGEKRNAIISAIPAGLVFLDTDHKILWANRVVEEWCSPLSQMLGRRCHEMIWAHGHPCKDCPTERALRTGEVEISEKAAINERGENKYFQIISSPMRDSQGGISGVVELVQDVTESKRLQAQLVQAAKMAAIGQLAAGVAHEINNPVGIILGKAELMLSSCGSVLPEKAVNDLQVIRRHTHRIAGITHRLLQFSRQGVEDWADIDLNELVQGVIPMLEHRLSAGQCRLELILDPDLPNIRGNVGQLEEVVLNLLDNAVDAMPHGGDVGVATRCVFQDKEGGANGSVLLIVRDAGVGIPGAIRDRIFDPFFTTKAVGKGTGLGLSILHGIVKNHGGEIKVESEPGKGTTFEIAFPRAKREGRLASSVASSS